MSEEFKPRTVGTFNPSTGKFTLIGVDPGAGDDRTTIAHIAPQTSLGRTLADVCAERARNAIRWGEQNYPSITGVAPGGGDPACHMHGIPTEANAKARVQRCAIAGVLTWTDVLLEEFAEAVAAPTEADRRGELVQVAAVALAWIECIDRRTQRAGGVE